MNTTKKTFIAIGMALLLAGNHYQPSHASAIKYEAHYLGTLGGIYSQALDINDQEQVVGISTTASGIVRAFIWQNNQMTDLGGPEEGECYALAINDPGEVVGYCNYAGAVIWRNGVWARLDSFIEGWIEATDINNRGTVVGSRDNGHAIVLKEGEVFDIGTLGGQFSRAISVNDRDQVIGEAQTASGEFHIFLWEDGAMSDLGIAVSGLQTAKINKHGKILAMDNGAGFFVNAGLPVFLANPSIVFDLNNKGSYVGEVELTGDGGSYLQPMLVTKDHVVSLGLQNGFSARPNSLNNKDVVVGFMQPTPGEEIRAVLWRKQEGN
jgi:probable HAF family extracellular repeat protein